MLSRYCKLPGAPLIVFPGRPTRTDYAVAHILCKASAEAQQDLAGNQQRSDIAVETSVDWPAARPQCIIRDKEGISGYIWRVHLFGRDRRRKMRTVHL